MAKRPTSKKPPRPTPDAATLAAARMRAGLQRAVRDQRKIRQLTRQLLALRTATDTGLFRLAQELATHHGFDLLARSRRIELEGIERAYSESPHPRGDRELVHG
jgi:hypothetical protein